MRRPAVVSLLTLLGMLLLVACTEGGASGNQQEQEVVEKDYKTASAVHIVFESGEKFTLTSPAALATCRDLITAEASAAFKCGYDGEIIYRGEDEALLEGEFNLETECQHIAFMRGGKLETRIMSAEGVRLLAGLRQSSGPGNTLTDLKNLRWMLGRWEQVESPAVVSYEEWEEVSELGFRGRAFTLQNSDTVFAEQLALDIEDGKVFYTPTLAENAGPVRFKLTSSGRSRAVFENPKHDFPQMITYKLVEDSILHARISGQQGGKEGFKDFFMKRAK